MNVTLRIQGFVKHKVFWKYPRLNPLLFANDPSARGAGFPYSTESEWTDTLNGLVLEHTVFAGVPAVSAATALQLISILFLVLNVIANTYLNDVPQ